jgi:hypothetical protein
MGLKKCIYSTYSSELHLTYDFVVLTSLTCPRKILLVVLQIGKLEIGKAKDLSAPLRNISKSVTCPANGWWTSFCI